ncbi:MAG TPA: DUF4097 family beta strand repeat-containing protein [Gemmatimonadaceae bacterium]|jgi:hypothetical protein|nr:DUF4097 family beta strand repeat-containing protein [Gemmatimonadaceae bacterium]
MRNLSIVATVAIVAVVASCGDRRSYPARNFTWTGDIAAGSTVNIRNIDGAIAIVPSANEKLSVDAVIMNAPASAVQVKQSSNGNNVYFCTLLGSRTADGCENTEGKHDTHFSPLSLFNRHHPITVRYTVHVPAGVSVSVETVSGKIAAQDIDGNVKASSVNGDVTVSTTKGTVNAETVNGSIVASMASLPDSGNVHLETVNGSITSLLPEGIGGSIDLENTNGTITANYPNAVQDKDDKHHMRIKLDEGQRRVTVETVNGSVNLAKYVKVPTVSLQN